MVKPTSCCSAWHIQDVNGLRIFKRSSQITTSHSFHFPQGHLYVLSCSDACTSCIFAASCGNIVMTSWMPAMSATQCIYCFSFSNFFCSSMWASTPGILWHLLLCFQTECQ